ncbi:DNA topoisomerase-1 [Cyclonatronum proteinivorum]|uniref:DNA topoisomerase 1 n=1 Tax=Cyclonatronum proteinivorum TaxID=1457365 RepID=A0A345UGM9_9BACT|nr:type I DNA topoisomerase [Cyclonatronum proteinivorum]AXI99630.1 DNA topoisomerase-1 [Cyclonatronum proteinivorum]
MKSLVIVESPTKAKTIKKYLPKGYVVDSSNGHIRDLPASAKEVPAKVKKEKWASLGINTEQDYEPLYVVSTPKKKVVKKLKDLIKEADELILATDEDREGEGISWHLKEVLKPKVPVKRMVFHEITEEAIKRALGEFRDIDMNLVDAQETRRIIDRLAGYTISPLLWKKIAPGLSAGRVQSVAVKLIVDRERERMRFRSGTYCDLKAVLNPEGKKSTFEAEMSELNGKRLASGKDFDENTGKLKKPDAVELLNIEQAEALKEQLLSKASWQVLQVDTKEQKRSPAPPFTTSTLQQESNRKFGFSAGDTMRVAQSLYEQGFITYMRTDSTFLSNQAIAAARSGVSALYGDEYLSEKERRYATKSKAAQEAHEAIRPAGSHFRVPNETGLDGRELKLYDLIWKRTVATQMAEARIAFTNVLISGQIPPAKDVLSGPLEGKSRPDGSLEARFKASGKKILFPGYFRAYVEGSDDPEAQLEDQDKPLPALNEADELACKKLEAVTHETKPPARFTEATLIKFLEKEGVGRPSTYASIIGTIQDRKYAQKEGSALVPSFTAFAVTELLETHFPDVVDTHFTSEMENQLDEIAHGNYDRLSYIRSYFEGEKGLKENVEKQESQIDPALARRINLPIEGLDGIELFVGRFGPYVQLKKDEETVSASIPESLAPCDLTADKIKELIEISEEGPDILGQDPETGENVYLLIGRYGPYVQLGEVTETNKKPKRGSLLKGMSPEDVDLKLALKLLSLPRTLGKHPETGEDVKAGVGRYGPFILHDGKFKSLGKDDNVLEVSLDRALEVLAQQKTAGKGRGRGSASVLRELGAHPKTGDAINILDGRYGPYIKFGKKNISLPKNADAQAFTLEEAVELIKQKTK